MSNIHKIQPSFTSNVYVLYNDTSYALQRTFYQSDDFINGLNSLKTNGKNDTVIISPMDTFTLEMQVSEKRDGKIYSATAYLDENPNSVVSTYKYARNNMEEIPPDVKVVDFLI